MAICTLEAHVSRAIDFYNKEDIYFVLGKTSVWGESDMDNYDSSIDYEVNPPVPKNTDKIKEVLGYRKADYKAMVIQDDKGTLTYRNTKWRVVDKKDALKQGARWVYISTELSYDDLPTEKPYRQIGVVSSLTKASGVEAGKDALIPSEVEDAGILEVIDNRKPTYRDTDVKEKIKLILEF